MARYERGTSLPAIPTLERLLRACGRSLVLASSRAASPPTTAVRGSLGPRAALLRRNRRRLLEAARRNGARNVRVFGSVARGQDTPTSDVDLLVELAPGRTLLDVVGFQQDASEILGLSFETRSCTTS